MADRPIIFSAPMVRALLDGRKTMTRRLATSPLAKARPGDRLWVRESFTRCTRLDDEGYPVGEEETLFAADGYPYDRWLDRDRDEWRDGPRWTPSIHMPRWASRITLTLTAVRTEKLHAITDADIEAEGLFRTSTGHWALAEGEGGHLVARNAFASLWMSLHVVGPGLWVTNPDLVVLTFTVARRNIDAG